MEGRGSKGPAVCVTGGTGFLGSWLIMKLLHHGYHVHATIRHNNNNKRDDGITFLTDLPGAAENLKLFEADLDHPETFSAAITGCSAVIHVATPALDLNNNKDHNNSNIAEEAIVERSISGTLGILKACLLHSQTVKRVVYTSGTAAVVYSMCATLTERKAVEFAREHGLDLVTLIPSIVVGPFICAKFPASIRLALAMVFGEKDDGGGDVMMTEVSMVHVDDVARAYVFLLENPTAEGRYICSSSRLTMDQRDKLSAKYPDLAVPAMKSLKDIKGLKVPKISSRKLLDAGFEFEYGLDDMFDAAIKCCKTKCYL
ncbi:unnamed protein product [Linum tenue]|uniref:NAD-dependent epimerase/dehydratase domain-containing protein n=1 Tax=Linum tenue TaxID=586396 RepID=A0AAV0NKS3_9ROSI|nr:unnamed protein product [Linum tenue]